MSLVPCTTPDCNRTTATYLCDICTRDLQAWLDRVPELREELFTTIARLDNTRPTGGQPGGGGGDNPGLPLRVGAMEARFALAIWEGRDARELATEDHAGGYIDFISKLIEHAEKLIDTPDEVFTHGPCGAKLGDGEDAPVCEAIITAPPEAVWVNCPECEAPHNVRERRQALLGKATECDPMPPRETIDWLHLNAGIKVKKFDFENWVKLGHLRYVLDRVTTDLKGKRLYFPENLFRVHHTMEKRKTDA